MSDKTPDETKAKFLEALQKKQAHAGRDVSDHGGTGKVAKGKGKGFSSEKTFRRKSG